MTGESMPLRERDTTVQAIRSFQAQADPLSLPR